MCPWAGLDPLDVRGVDEDLGTGRQRVERAYGAIGCQAGGAPLESIGVR
jgi:hypothetical protein